MSVTEIEKRLAKIEREIAALRSERAGTTPTHPIQAIERIHGAFENDEAFKEAVRLGRKWRESQRFPIRKSKAKRK
ncbi:MAG TPA: hypothetical protein VFC46_16625 [Humisphaera sp.]|nr:hypothetical protein [Humisphaera sp.]